MSITISRPFGPASTRRNASPSATRRNPFANSNDTLDLGSLRPTEMAPNLNTMPVRKPASGGFRKLVLATTLAVSLFSAVAPLPALAAQPIAQSAVATQTVEAARTEAAQKQAVDGAVDDALKGLAGKDTRAMGAQCVDVDARCLADFATLTPEGKEAYRKIPLVGKQIMAKQLNGSYKLFGFIPIVNYREAYIKGEAFGKNAFDFTINEVNKREAAGKLSPQNAHNSRWFLQLSSRMTPAQRGALVRLINQDVRINGGK